MPILTFAQAVEWIKEKGGPLLALDHGKKTMGVAFTDPHCKIAVPSQTLSRKGIHKDAAIVVSIFNERAATLLLLGWPLHANGQEGRRCQSVRHFAGALLKQEDIPILFWDERYSTAIMEDALIDIGTRPQKRAQIIDSMAALYILQSFLEEQHPL